MMILHFSKPFVWVTESKSYNNSSIYVLMIAKETIIIWNPSSTVIVLISYSCFTTEILEGFDVQRTSGLADTLKKYVHLTQAITQYYKSEYLEEQSMNAGVCPSFDEFIKRCQDLDKMTVSDVFAIQLMQVWTVSERKEYHLLFDS